MYFYWYIYARARMALPLRSAVAFEFGRQWIIREKFAEFGDFFYRFFCFTFLAQFNDALEPLGRRFGECAGGLVCHLMHIRGVLFLARKRLRLRSGGAGARAL